MGPRTEGDAALFGIAYLGVKDIYSADNSSPQTTHLNAHKRAPTLMKWVNIAAVESLAVVWLLSLTAPKGHKKWPALGGLLALVITYAQYLYARACGLREGGATTEDYGGGSDGYKGGQAKYRGEYPAAVNHQPKSHMQVAPWGRFR